jgi:hypothetical protein
LKAFSFLRPHDTLVIGDHWGESLKNEFLNPLSAVGFGSEYVPPGIGSDAMDRVELTWLPAAVTKASEHFHGLSIKNVDLFVRSVGYVYKLLPGI